jgi:hypothetical protein
MDALRSLEKPEVDAGEGGGGEGQGALDLGNNCHGDWAVPEVVCPADIAGVAEAAVGMVVSKTRTPVHTNTVDDQTPERLFVSVLPSQAPQLSAHPL